MTDKEVAAILDEIGTLLELKGENPFKCRAYHNASRIIGALTVDLTSLISSGELNSIKGIGQGLAEKITELVRTGKSGYHEELKASLPSGLLEMLRIPGLGPKRVKILYDRLKIKSLQELKSAAAAHALGRIEGFGEKTEENILQGIASLETHADKHLFSEASEAAERILEAIAAQAYVIHSDVAGSLRRRKEIIGDIDILASVRKGRASDLMALFTSHPDAQRIIARGETKSSVLLSSGINCDLRVIEDQEYPFALAYFTGSKEHNVELRSLAKRFDLSLNEYGFSRLGSGEKRGKAKRVIPCKSEADIYRELGLAYIPPELRENTGEIDAARLKALPRLIEEKDITGTFHCHTSYSDGVNTLAEMASAARALGWKYLGIADHSKIAAYARGLSESRVKQQRKEIDTLNRDGDGFHIFHGTEVDILADGTLDWTDRILAGFDYVVASIHSKFKMTEKEATRRIIRAIKNRYVTMLGHPTGRLLLEREGYPVNMIDVINAASDYGTVIEINAHPMRLDLDWRFCHYAKEKGVRISINPDAHTVNGLKDVSYGVGIARKGWLEKADVINTYELDDLTRFLKNRKQNG